MAHPMIAPAFITLGGKVEGRLDQGPTLWRFARAATPLLPATCQQRPRACAHVRSRQLPSLRAPGIHRPVGQARAPCALPTAGS